MAKMMQPAAPVQKVVVVDGDADVLGMLEAVLDAGRYDMVFVESSDHAYSQIRKVLPNLVIVCAQTDRSDAFQLLTMLTLDAETRAIPVLTYTADAPERRVIDRLLPSAEDDDDLLPARRAPAPRMN
jgi:PleD family two-component response regulator